MELNIIRCSRSAAGMQQDPSRFTLKNLNSNLRPSNSMDYNIHKECEKTPRERNKGNRQDEGIDGIGSQEGTFHSGTRDPMYLAESYAGQNVDGTSETGNKKSLDLGKYYIDRAVDVMEQWHSKPREGYHVSDTTMCHRLKVFQTIDRRPLGPKNVCIFSIGKAMHEAIQLLFRSDKRTFEIEKYVEHQDIQESVDIYDRRRNIPLEFKTIRASDIKEAKSFHVEQLRYYMSILGAEEGYVIYQLLMHFGERPLKHFRISMNAQQRQAQLDKLVEEVNSLKRAMQARDPSLARSVSQDPNLNWMCRDCPYSIECNRIEAAARAA